METRNPNWYPDDVQDRRWSTIITNYNKEWRVREANIVCAADVARKVGKDIYELYQFRGSMRQFYIRCVNRLRKGLTFFYPEYIEQVGYKCYQAKQGTDWLEMTLPKNFDELLETVKTSKRFCNLTKRRAALENYYMIDAPKPKLSNIARLKAEIAERQAKIDRGHERLPYHQARYDHFQSAFTRTEYGHIDKIVKTRLDAEALAEVEDVYKSQVKNGYDTDYTKSAIFAMNFHLDAIDQCVADIAEQPGCIDACYTEIEQYIAKGQTE